jgi:hypothetical protein
MEAAAILIRARELGIILEADGEAIVARPRGATPPDLAAAIRVHKVALLAALTVSPPAADASSEEAKIARIARLDAERREADRQTKRGYDFDATAPSQADYLPAQGHPAYAIITACQRYGIALRIDASGDLVVGKAGAKAGEPSQPWPSLLRAIEAHLEAVARLVDAGWTLRADFPHSEVA